MDAPTASAIDHVSSASRRLVRTVDALTDAQYAEPSLLPRWSRAHVVAHLTLNAEGLARALHGVATGEPAAMYDSQDARDRDIEEVSGWAVDDLRERFLAAGSAFADGLAHLPADGWDGSVERTPGGPTISVHSIPRRRWVEVEVHHADLGAGYRATDWPTPFLEVLIPLMVRRLHGESLTLRATDLDQTWEAGEGGPEISGAAADLGWWLSGRGNGEGLTGPLPRIGGW